MLTDFFFLIKPFPEATVWMLHRSRVGGRDPAWVCHPTGSPLVPEALWTLACSVLWKLHCIPVTDTGTPRVGRWLAEAYSGVGKPSRAVCLDSPWPRSCSIPSCWVWARLGVLWPSIRQGESENFFIASSKMERQGKLEPVAKDSYAWGPKQNCKRMSFFFFICLSELESMIAECELCRWQHGVASQNLDTSIKSKILIFFSGSLWRRKSQLFLACLPAGKFHFYCLPWGRSHEPGTKEDISLSQLSGFQTPSVLPSRSQRQNNRKQSRPDHTAPLFKAFYWALSKTHVLPCIRECICHLWPSWPHFPILRSGTTLRALQPHSSSPMWDYWICRVSGLCGHLPCHLTSAFSALSLPSSHDPFRLFCFVESLYHAWIARLFACLGLTSFLPIKSSYPGAHL